jgi:hypothetical protein
VTHNVFPFRDGILLNDTESDRISFANRNGEIIRSFPIKKYEEKALENANLSKDMARQAFGRGLCVFNDLIIGGSSPATISVYNSEYSTPLKTVNITMDVRNAIHGLEVWPF